MFSKNGKFQCSFESEKIIGKEPIYAMVSVEGDGDSVQVPSSVSSQVECPVKHETYRQRYATNDNRIVGVNMWCDWLWALWDQLSFKFLVPSCALSIIPRVLLGVFVYHAKVGQAGQQAKCLECLTTYLHIILQHRCGMQQSYPDGGCGI